MPSILIPHQYQNKGSIKFTSEKHEITGIYTPDQVPD